GKTPAVARRAHCASLRCPKHAHRAGESLIGQTPQSPAQQPGRSTGEKLLRLALGAHHYTQVAKILLHQLLIDNRVRGTPACSSVINQALRLRSYLLI